jgi:hypothetical protein
MISSYTDCFSLIFIRAFCKTKTALYKVPVPKDGPIPANPIAKAIGEEIESVSPFAKGSPV